MGLVLRCRWRIPGRIGVERTKMVKRTRSGRKLLEVRVGILAAEVTLMLTRAMRGKTGPPQKCFDWPPPKLSKCWNHIHFARHLGVFRSEGGPVWDSDDFLNSVTYRPTLSKFRGGPVKKITLYVSNDIAR